MLVIFWIGIDITYPTRTDLRAFDPHKVAQLEAHMWRSYYRHDGLRLFGQLAELMTCQYGMPFWRAQLAAFHAARAAVVFQRGRDRTEYLKALPSLQSFYRLVERSSGKTFDADKAAILEVQWWIVQRQGLNDQPGDLQRALAEVQAEIYRQHANRFEGHATARAQAMLLRDLAGQSGNMSEADWAQVGGLLDRSWRALRTAVEQSPVP